MRLNFKPPKGAQNGFFAKCPLSWGGCPPRRSGQATHYNPPAPHLGGFFTGRSLWSFHARPLRFVRVSWGRRGGRKPPPSLALAPPPRCRLCSAAVRRCPLVALVVVVLFPPRAPAPFPLFVVRCLLRRSTRVAVRYAVGFFGRSRFKMKSFFNGAAFAVRLCSAVGSFWYSAALSNPPCPPILGGFIARGAG